MISFSKKISNEFRLFAKYSFISFFIMVATGILNFLIRVILQHSLSERDYGFFYSAMALVLFCLGFTDIGMGQALVILTARAKKNGQKLLVKEQFKNILQMKLLLGSICFLLLLAVSPLIVKYYLKSTSGIFIFLTLASYAVLQSLESAYACFFNGLKKYKSFTAVPFFRALFQIILLLLLLPVFGLNAASISFVTASLLLVIIAFLYTKSKLKIKINFCSFSGNYNSIIKFCSYLAISMAILNSMYYLDIIMLTSIKGLESSAKYNLALPIIHVINSLLVIVGVITPIASDLWIRKDYKQLKRFADYSFLLTFISIPFIYVFFINFGGDIINLIFKTKDYKILSVTVTILCCGMAFSTLNRFLFQILNSGHCEKKVTLITLIGILINVTLNIVLIRHYDFNGAAFATTLTYLIMSILSFVVLRKNLHEKYHNSINKKRSLS